MNMLGNFDYCYPLSLPTFTEGLHVFPSLEAKNTSWYNICRTTTSNYCYKVLLSTTFSLLFCNFSVWKVNPLYMWRFFSFQERVFSIWYIAVDAKETPIMRSWSQSWGRKTILQSNGRFGVTVYNVFFFFNLSSSCLPPLTCTKSQYDLTDKIKRLMDSTHL